MRIIYTWPLVVAFLMQIGCGSSSKTQAPSVTKHESPQAAYDAFSKAGQDGDWKALAAALTPESQEAMAAMLLLPAGMAAAFNESAGEELEQILERHELSGDALEGGASNLPVKDKPAFIADVAEWLMRQGGDSSDLGIPLGDLADVEIKGDSATASIGGEPISFRRMDGGWLVQLETPASKLDDVPLSADPLQGRIGGELWTLKSIEKGPFGGFKLLADERDESSRFSSGPHILLGEAWEALKPGPGRLGGRRNITLFVPPGSNTICMNGKYEVTESNDSWVLLLYASEGDDTFVNGKVVIPKTLLNE